MRRRSLPHAATRGFLKGSGEHEVQLRRRFVQLLRAAKICCFSFVNNKKSTATKPQTYRQSPWKVELQRLINMIDYVDYIILNQKIDVSMLFVMHWYLNSNTSDQEK